MFLGVFHASAALHVATPVELTVTVPRACILVSVVAAATAQQVTPARPWRGSVATPANSAQRAHGRVHLAVIRTPLQVHHMRLAGPSSSPFGPHQPQVKRRSSSTLVYSDGLSLLIFVKEMLPDECEGREGLPAGFDSAGARHPVALALGPHRAAHRPASRPVVVEVHEGAAVPLHLAGVQELASEPDSEPNVRTAAAPLPAGGTVPLSLSVVTATGRDVAPGAGGCHAVGHPCTGHCVRIGSFAAPHEDDVAESAGAGDGEGTVPSMVLELTLALP